MSKRPTDPIIDEFRAARGDHAARFNYDIDAIFRDIRAMEKMSGRRFVRLRPRRCAPPGNEPDPEPDKSGGTPANPCAASFQGGLTRTPHEECLPIAYRPVEPNCSLGATKTPLNRPALPSLSAKDAPTNPAARRGFPSSS